MPPARVSGVTGLEVPTGLEPWLPAGGLDQDLGLWVFCRKLLEQPPQAEPPARPWESVLLTSLLRDVRRRLRPPLCPRRLSGFSSSVAGIAFLSLRPDGTAIKQLCHTQSLHAQPGLSELVPCLLQTQRAGAGQGGLGSEIWHQI